MCIFCSIVKGEIPGHKVYEDDKTLAFLDINPSAPGHTMVIPKEHHPDVSDMPDSLVGDVFKSVQRVTKMLSKALGTNHFTTGYNMGKLSGQEVDHLHVHIIPRFEGDGMSGVQSVVSNTPKESLEEIRDKIVENGN